MSLSVQTHQLWKCVELYFIKCCILSLFVMFVRATTCSDNPISYGLYTLAGASWGRCLDFLVPDSTRKSLPRS